MIYHSGSMNRHSIRLKGYDYSNPGFYFVTICTQNHDLLFGDIVDGKMILNEPGKMVQEIWNQIPIYYRNISINSFQVMPNHIHGIIAINNPFVGADPRVCPGITDPRVCPGITDPRVCPGITDPRVCHEEIEQITLSAANIGQTQGSAPTDFVDVRLSLADVVKRFKTMTTKKYIDNVRIKHRIPFKIRLWQRNYWEHIISREKEYCKICDYIEHNPERWNQDSLNLKANTVREGIPDYETEEYGMIF